MSHHNPLLSKSQALADRLTAWRRDFHRHPELAFEEQRTAGIVAEHLTSLGLEVRTDVGRTGVVAVLEGAAPGPTVLLRFDMDALPITEETGLPFASQEPGKMHACGHDGHTAIGLGLATLLAGHQTELAGRVKFLFQPAEETTNGAKAMIEDGALLDPRPDVAFGLHLWSQSPVGQAAIGEGTLWASADRFDIEIIGRGAHGALPQQGVDAIVVAAQAIAQLQTVVTRSLDPLEPAVLSVGIIQGGSAYNILAERVHLTGTLRTFAEGVRATVVERMHQLLGGLCQGYGAHYELSLSNHVPPLTNDPTATAHLRAAATAVLGEEGVQEGSRLTAAEDMAEFLNRVPGCYFLLGAMKEGPEPAEPHHSPRFDIDERALSLGVAILAQATLSYLRPPAQA